MQTGYYSATGGMVTQFNRLDVISNNLANLNTNAYKRDDVVVGDFLRLYQEARDELPLRNHTKEASKFLNRSMDRVPQIVESYTDRSIGAMKQTGNPLDFALQKPDQFFAVETPNGIRYTRDGAFNIDGEGRLVTKEGFPVLPRDYFESGQGYITIPEDAGNAEVTVDKNGNIYQEETQFSNIAVISFDNAKYLQKEGGSLYKTERPEERNVLEESGSVVNGFVEKSNINAVSEMVGLIETNRLVDMYQKVMKTHMDDLNTEAITKLANTKA